MNLLSSLSSPEAAVSVSGWETVRDELEETKNVSKFVIHTHGLAEKRMVKVDKAISTYTQRFVGNGRQYQMPLIAI